MKMKKLSEEHYIVVDDSEIKGGDWIGFLNLEKFVPVQYFGGDLTGGEKKITHSTQPLDCACSNRGYKLNTNCAERNRCFDKVQYLPLQEVKEVLGVVDVETKAHNWSTRQTTRSTDYWRSMVSTYVEAYNECLEDNKEKKYTEEDLMKFYKYVKTHTVTEALRHIQPKTEWEVEFVDGKLKLKS